MRQRPLQIGRRDALFGTALLALLPHVAAAHPAQPVRAARDYARRILAAQAANQRVARASSLVPGMNEDRAYAFQRAIVAAMPRRGRVAGTKGGGMTAPAQARLGGGPFLGILPARAGARYRPGRGRDRIAAERRNDPSRAGRRHQWRSVAGAVVAGQPRVERHGPLRPGCLVITGALSGALIARAGRCQADFGASGTIAFSVE
jgi:hypothetical protein